ncbi:hypothetical protein GCK32_000125 [Trichostrongylus colubriformis]|uniref:Uncharacterized protein n=1 Tax=Trichostrongylus colubriformis TaxID=6319 RepID=A0AAN8IMJ5_TRICO
MKKNGPKLYSSPDGRFSIINESAKDNSDSDADSPLPVYNRSELANQRFVRSTLSQSVDSCCSQSKATASTTPSRFRIVPLESKYVRGRWNCFDYYDKDTASKQSAKARAPDSTITRQTSSSGGRSVRSLNSGYSLQGKTRSDNPTIPFDGSSESDRENNEVFARSTPTFSRTSAPPHPETNFTPNNVASTLNNKKGSNRAARKATDERLQRGLESSLAPNQSRSQNSSTRRSDLLTGTNNAMGQPSTSAIDSKIEQAMDLVKTHLMFAVREELDVLRGKITELESNIFRLETENAVIKANIPSDILRNLSLDHTN